MFGKANEPILLTYTLPLFKEDRVVKVQIYAPGTVASPGTLLSTETLTHQSSGRYSKLYTPPDNYDFLDLIYIIYKADGVTFDPLYNPFKEQLVLSTIGGGVSYVGGGGGMTTQNIEEIATAVWNKKLAEVENGSAGLYLKSLATKTTEIGANFKKGLKGIVDKLQEGTDKLTNLIAGLASNVDLNLENQNVVHERIGKLDNMTQIQGLGSQISQSVFLLKMMEMLDKRIDSLLGKYKNPNLGDFMNFMDDLSKNNNKLEQSQIKFLSDFAKNKITEFTSDISLKSIQNTANSLTALAEKQFGKGNKETQDLVKQLQRSADEQQKSIKKTQEDMMNINKTVITTIQNNILALAKLIEKNKNNPSFDNILDELDGMKKYFNA